MNEPSLSPKEIALLRGVFGRHPELTEVRLFGSRAKGTHTASSDIDLALWGEIGPLQAEAIGAELDDLPLPYRYDMQAFDSIRSQPLREHIERVGIRLYPDVAPSLLQAANAGSISYEATPWFDDLVKGRKDFWAVACVLRREDLITLVNRALRETGGSYKKVAELFHMAPNDHAGLTAFLRPA